MNANVLYEAIRLRWPRQREADRAGWIAVWGPEIGAVSDAQGIAAVAAHARASKFPPALAEFLAAVRVTTGRPDHGPRPIRYPCASPTCRVVSLGPTELAKHEAGCASAQAVFEAGRAHGAQQLAAWRAQHGAAAPACLPAPPR